MIGHNNLCSKIKLVIKIQIPISIYSEVFQTIKVNMLTLKIQNHNKLNRIKVLVSVSKIPNLLLANQPQ